MDMETEKLQLIQMLLETEDKSLLAEIKTLFDKHSKGDIWDEWDDEVRRDVEEAIAELDRGEGIPHEKAIAMLKKW